MHSWELAPCGRALPAPEIDYPFWMRYVLGLDGGGTKTDCVLMDETGAILARSRSGPSNPSRIGFDATVAALYKAAEKTLAASGTSAHEIAAIHAGVAGAGAAGVIPNLTQALKIDFPRASVLINTDLVMALAATQETPSVAVIAGTGSAVIGRGSSGQLTREGGLGPILGDPSSAYDIGRRAVALGLRHHLLGGSSPLGEAILKVVESDWAGLQERIRVDSERILPKIFPVVVDAANKSDESANALLRSAAEELSELAILVIERLELTEKPFFLAKTGGVFGRSASFDGAFDAAIRRVASQARIGPLQPIAEFAARAALACLHSPSKHPGK
jgi:N-acetylglucosamine kinase-like BadF-type ATPase